MARRCGIPALFSLLVACVLCVPSAAQPDASEAASPEKALRYHSVLAKRPSPGYLFDRFYNAWLDESTVGELESFLQQREKQGRTEDALLLAFFYAKQGDDQQAIERFRETLAKTPGSAEAWYQKAVVEARTLDFETALADLEKALAAKPKAKLEIDAVNLQGKLLVRTQQPDKALQAWAELLSRHPDDADLAETVLDLQLGEGLYKEAEALCKKIIEESKDPYRKVLGQLRLGDVLQRGGDRDAAVKAYRTALDQVGADSWLEREILAQIERVYRREDDITGLAKQYESLVEQYPRRVGVHRAFSRVLSESGETDKAIQRFRELLKLTPGDRANEEAFVELHVQAEKLTEAIKLVEKLAEQHPRDAELLVQLAQLNAKADQKPTAAQTVDRYLKVAEKTEYSHLRAARLLEQFEMTDAAKEKYALLTKLFPESDAAFEAQAAFLYAAGDKEPALAIWRRLADKADAAGVVRLARTMASRQEHQAQFELLQSREKEFANEPLYLAQLTTAAIALKKPEEAIEWARRRVDLADASSELDDSLAQAVLVIDRADKTPEIKQELEAQEKRSPQRACLLAELYEKIGESDSADTTLQPLVESGDPLATLTMVRLASSRREWTEATDAMRRLIDLAGGRTSRNVRRLVEFYERDYQIDKAIEWIAEWKRLSPGSTMPWLVESRLRSVDGDVDAAIDTLRRAVRQFDDNEDLRTRLAALYSQSGKQADAERIYWRQYEDSESLSDKLRFSEQLARSAEQQGKLKHLVENFEERRRNNRSSIEPLLALAQIHRIGDDYEARRQALTEAAKLKPDDLELLGEIARVEEQEGDWERARRTLERAAPLDKTSRTRQRIARLLLRYGDAEEGYSMLMTIAGDDNADPRDVEQIATAMVSAGDWDRAAAFLAKWVDTYPNDYRLRYLRAVLLEDEWETATATEEFFAVLRTDQEIKSKSVANTGMPNWYFTQLRETLPTETVDLLQLMQSTSSAYQHQRQSGMSYSGGGRGSVIGLPHSLENAHTYATIHLARIGSNLEEEEQQPLIARLKAADVSHADILVATSNQANSVYSSAGRLSEEFPDSDALLGLAVLYGANQQGGASSELYQRAWDRFRERYPVLALTAAIQGSRVDESLAPLLEEASSALDAIEKPNAMVVMQLCQSLRVRGSQAGSVELPAAFREKLTQKLVAWLPTVRSTPQYGPYLTMQVAAAVRATGDVETFIKFLDQEISDHRRNKQSGRSSMPQQFGRQPTLLSLPPFPPQQLPGMPAMIMQMLTQNQQLQQAYGLQTDPDWDEESLAKQIEKARDPVLRLLLTAGADGDVDPLIKKMLEDETPSLDALLIASSHASEKEQYVDALRHLETARFLPMDRAARKRLDAWMIALAVEDPTQIEGDEALLKMGRDAALRLRRSSLNGNERSELVAAMTQLGLNKEADRLEKVAAATPSPSTSSAYYGSASVASATPQDRIAKLIADGKQETAVKLLKGDVLNMARQAAANPMNWSYNRHQFRQLRDRLAKYGVIDEILSDLTPRESDSHRKWADYAAACEVLDKRDASADAWRRAVALRPKDANYLASLIVALARNGDPDAKELIAKADERTAGMIVSQVLQRAQDYEETIDARLELFDLSIAAFTSLAEQPRANLSWAESLCQAIARPMNVRSGPSLTSLYSKQTQSSSADNKKNPTLRRRQLHERLCQNMLKHPATSRAGFTHLLALQEAAGKEKEIDALAPVAKRVLLGQKRRRAVGVSPVTQHVHYSSNNDDVSLQTPEAFFLRHAWRNEDWPSVDQVVEHLKEQGLSKQAKEIEAMRAMISAPSDQFIEAAGAYLRAAQKNANPTPHLPQSQQAPPEVLICDVWKERELEMDLRPMLLEQLKKNRTPQGTLAMPAHILAFTRILAKKYPESLMEWFEQLSEAYTGPLEKREAFIARHHHPNQGVSHGTPSADAYILGQFLGQCLTDPQLVIPASKHMVVGKVAKLVQNADYSLRSGMTKVAKESPEELVKALEDLGLLGDATEFAEAAATELGSGTVFSALNRALQGGNSTKQKELKKLLGDRDETFGALMMLSAISPDDQSLNMLFGKVVEQRESLDKLTPSLAGGLARQLNERLETHRRSRSRDFKLSDDASRALEWIREQLKSSGQRKAEKLLAARRWEDLDGANGDPTDWLRPLVRDAWQASPKQAVDVYLKFCELYQDGMKRNVVHYHFGDDPQSQMVQRLSNEWDRNDPTFAMFVLELLEDPRCATIALDRYTIDRTSQALQEQFRRSRSSARERKESGDSAVIVFHTWLEEQLDGRSPVALSSKFHDILNGLNTKDRTKAIEWLTKRATKEDDNGLAASMAAALQMAAARRSSSPSNKGDAAERLKSGDHHPYYSAVLENPDLSIPTRLVAAQGLFRSESERMPLDVAVKFVRLGDEACRQKVGLSRSAHSDLVRTAVSLLPEEAAHEALDTLAESWMARYGQPPRRNAMGRVPSDLSDATLLSRMLKFYLARGDDQRVQKMLARFSPVLSTRYEPLALLTRYDRIDRAAAMARTALLAAPLNFSRPLVVRLDDKLEEQTPKLLEKLRNDGERFLVQTAFARLDDSSSKQQEERLLALAKQFGEVTFPSDAVKNKAILAFKDCHPAWDSLQEPLAEAAQKVNLPAMSNGDHRLFETARHLLAMHVEHAIKQRDYKPLASFIKQTKGDDSGRDYQLRNALSNSTRQFADALTGQLEEMEPQQFHELSPTLREWATPSRYSHLNNRRQLTTLCLVAHLDAAQEDPFLDWLKGLDDYAQDQLRNYGLDNKLQDWLNQTCPEKTADTLEQRRERFLRLVRLMDAGKWLSMDDSLRIQMKGLHNNSSHPLPLPQFFTPEELAELGESLTTGMTESGFVYRSLAAELTSNKRHATAADCWRSFLALEVCKQNAAKRNQATIALVESLAAADQMAEAAAELKKIEPEKLPSRLRKTYNELAKKTTPQVEAPASEEPSAEKEPDTAPAHESSDLTKPAKSSATEEKPSQTAPEESHDHAEPVPAAA